VKRRGRALRRRYGHSKRSRKRASLESGSRTIHNVNASDRDWAAHNFIFGFGAYGDTLVRAWGRGVEDALEHAMEWIADHEPGILANEAVQDEYKRALAEGKSEEEAIEEAEVDTTQDGSGNYVNSWEWTIVAEDPTREQVLQIQGRR
jgi:hypothetical protein